MSTRSDGQACTRRLVAAMGALALMLGVTGCAGFPPQPAERPDQSPEDAPPQVAIPAPEPGVDSIGAVLRYRHHLNGASEAELQSRLRRLEERITAGECDEARLRYAMTLERLAESDRPVSPNQSLAPCVGPTAVAHRPNVQLARLLTELWSEQRVSAQYQREATEYRRRLEAEQAETARLRRQLEGLKAIERSIQQRDKDKEGRSQQ